MNGYTFKSRLLASSVFAGAAFGLVATGAVAQEAEDDEARQETITVTGSRIAKADFVSNSPIATVGSEQFDLTGTVNTESLLNTLPQTVPGLDRTSNNPGNGTATVDLRGLGANRTLVLLDGKRMVPTSGNGVVDINTIPAPLIERVEVVTGGASAVYGSDAIAGVVNFILKDDFEGVEASAGYEVTGEGDADIWSASLTTGANFDNGRGNAVLSLGYTNRAELFQGDRDFAFFAQFDDGDGGTFNGGSSGIPDTSVFSGEVGPGTPADCASFGIAFNQDGSIRCFNDDFFAAENDFYNYAPVNYIQLPQERFQATGLASYEINESIEVYSKFVFAFNDVPQQLAPTPIFQAGSVISLDNNPFITPGAQATLSGNNTDHVGFGNREARVFSDFGGEAQTGFVFADDDVNQVNPLNTCLNCVFDASFFDDDEDGIDDAQFNDTAPIIDTDGDGIADLATLFLRRRLEEVGARISDDQFSAFQFVAGVRGDISPNMAYDVSYQEGRVLNSSAQRGNVSVTRFLQALRLADADGDGNVDLDANGNATCSNTSTNGATVGCSPLNLYGQGNISPTAAAFLRTAVNSDARYNQRIFNATLTGDTAGAIELPGGPIGLAGGFEYREEEFDFDPSQDLASGNIAGFNGAPPVAGSFDVYDIYGEFYAPLLADAPFADLLAIEGAYRYSDYSSVGGVEAYKIAGEWAPVDQLRFRTSFNTAVRAPNVVELFLPVSEGFPGAVDPCSAANPNADDVSATCIATGVPAALVGSPALNLPSGQVRALGGGNPDLSEETAETLTAGFVASPDFIPGLTFSVDYFDIEITDAIAAFGGGAANILNTCYNNAEAGGPGSAFCSVITRRSDGTILSVSAQSQNVASIGLKGFDVQANYDFELGDAGNFGIVYLGTFTDESTFEAFPGADVEDCAGEFGTLICGEPVPAYKHRTTLRWANGPFTGQLLWRYVGEVDDDDDGTDYAVETIDGTSYFDVSGSWRLNDNFTLTGGVDNLLDEEPPILGDNQEQANTWPATYDVFGRTFFVKGTVTF